MHKLVNIHIYIYIFILDRICINIRNKINIHTYIYIYIYIYIYRRRNINTPQANGNRPCWFSFTDTRNLLLMDGFADNTHNLLTVSPQPTQVHLKCASGRFLCARGLVSVDTGFLWMCLYIWFVCVFFMRVCDVHIYIYMYIPLHVFTNMFTLSFQSFSYIYIYIHIYIHACMYI